MVKCLTKRGRKYGVIVKENAKTVVIKLEDGNYTKRKKSRDQIQEVTE